MLDTGNRKATITVLAVTGLLAAGAYVPATIVACTYLVVNAVLHALGKSGVDDTAGE